MLPLNVWMSEGAMQMAFVTLGSALYWAYRSHGWVQHCRHSDDPLDWAWVARWEHVRRVNVAWLLCTVLLLAFQIRLHLYQIGAMPMPFK